MASLFFIFLVVVGCDVSILLCVWLFMIVIFHHLHHHRRLLVEKIYFWYFVGWSTTSLQYSVPDFVYLSYMIFIPLTLTAILYIVVVVAADYRYIVSPLFSLLYGVVVLGSIPSLPWNHPEGFCVAVSLMHRIWYVPHLD